MRTRSKVVVLVAMAVVTAAAFAIPTAATAEKTSLCREDSASTCPEGLAAKHVHLATAEKAKLLSSIVEAKCNVLLLGDVLSESSTPLDIDGNFTYTNCETSTGTACTVTETSGNSTASVLKLGHELADVTYRLAWNVHCGFLINCTYDGEGLLSHALGPLLASGENGVISLKEQVTHKISGVCPGTAKLDIAFEPLEPLYIREGKPLTALCSKDEGTPICQSENQLKSIDYKDSAVELLTNLINIKCEGLASGTVGAPGNPLEIKAELTYTGCSGGCFVTSVAGPGKIMLQREGVAEEAKATSEGFEIFVKCGTTIKCLLGPEKMAGKALGALTTGDNGHLTFSKVSMGKGEGATCPKEATLDALYLASSAAYIG